MIPVLDQLGAMQAFLVSQPFAIPILLTVLVAEMIGFFRSDLRNWLRN